MRGYESNSCSFVKMNLFVGDVSTRAHMGVGVVVGDSPKRGDFSLFVQETNEQSEFKQSLTRDAFS